jgi:hypothetical protein
VQKVKINNEALFEIRYVQYFNPQHLFPFFNHEKKMQTRVQLIDARDSNGNKLPKRESLKLLKTALRSQDGNIEYILMPNLRKGEAEFFLENLKYATTLACGRTSHKVTSTYHKDLSRAEIMLMKLKTIFSIREDRAKSAAFSQIKLFCVKSMSSEQNNINTMMDLFSVHSLDSKNKKLKRMVTDSYLKRTQCTYEGQRHNYRSGKNTNLSRGANSQRLKHSFPLSCSLIGNILNKNQGMMRYD